MTNAEGVDAGLAELGVAGRELSGEAQSGDLHAARPYPGGLMVAAIDGLGHGDEAAAAAGVARSTLEEHAGDAPQALVERCHKRLRRTRGVVMSLASFSERANTMTWVGVGNVEGRLLRAGAEDTSRGESILLHGGVVGYQLPQLRPAVMPVAVGDLLIFATDGIHADFLDRLDVRGAPQEIADRVLARHAKESDDALVVVARYRGAER